jgi:hypothetical protein
MNIKILFISYMILSISVFLKNAGLAELVQASDS